MTGNLEAYIGGHIDREPDELFQIDRQSNLRLLNGRMCSGHIQGRLLKMLVRMINPQRVLELGTFSGYSALCLAEGLTGDATVDTIEYDDELEGIIRRNLLSSPFGDKVRLHIGDALEVMKEWEDSEFDLIFIDADKRNYPEYYESSMRLLKDGGFMIADNTLWDGHVIEEGRHSPQTEGVIRFNDIVSRDHRVEKAMIPLRDGLTLIHKLPSGGR